MNTSVYDSHGMVIKSSASGTLTRKNVVQWTRCTNMATVTHTLTPAVASCVEMVAMGWTR